MTSRTDIDKDCVIFELAFAGLPPDGLRLGIDSGLNTTLFRAVNEQFKRPLPFKAHIFRQNDVTVRGGWGYFCDGDVDKRDRILRGTGWSTGHIEHANQKALEHPPSAPPAYIEGRVINTLWPGVMTYGHWLLDTIPRLGMLRTLGLDFDQCVALLPANSSFYMREILSVFGILKYHEVGWNQDVVCRELYSPGHCRSITAYPRELYLDTYNFFRSAMEKRISTPLTPSGKTQVLIKHTPITSRGVDDRKIVNENDLEDQFLQRQFKILNPLELSFAEQFDRFRCTSVVAGVDSSGLHNAIFARATLDDLIVLCPPWRFNYNHYLVATVMGAKLTLVAGLTTDSPGNFAVDKATISKVLGAIIG